MAMLGSDIHEILQAILPEDALDAMIEEAKFQQRERKCEAVHLIRTMILSASSGRGGRLVEVMELYFKGFGARVARSSFYSWFGKSLEQGNPSASGVSRSVGLSA